MAEVEVHIPAGTQNIVDSIAGNLGVKAGVTETAPEVSLATAVEKTEKVAELETKVVKLEATKEVEANNEFEALSAYLDEDKPAETSEVLIGDGKVVTKEEKDYSEYINKAKEYDEAMSIPLAKAVVEMIKSGKTDLNEIAAELGFENLDKKSSRDVYEAGLKAEGYDEQTIETEMNDFDNLDNKVKQDRLAKPYRDVQKTAQAEKLKNFTSGLPQANKAEQERVAVVNTTATKELEMKVNALKGKKYEGLLTITEDMIPQIMKVASQYATPIFDDNNKITGYDLEGGIEAAVLKLNKKSIIKAALTTGGTEGFLKFYKARVSPKSNEHSTTAPVMERDIKDDLAEVIKQRTGR